MQKWFFILIGLFVSAKPLHAQLQLGPIGTWRAHFSNESIQQVIKGDQLYVAAANQIIQVDANKQTNYLNTTNGLHAIGIHKIAWHPIENQLVIAKQILEEFKDINKKIIHQSSHILVFKTLMLHYMTPMTCTVANTY